MRMAKAVFGPGDDIDDAGGFLMERKEFVEQAALLIRKAIGCRYKTRDEGLLALEYEIDEGLAARGDLFECGLRLAVDGAETSAILDEALSQMIALVTDENARRLKTMQKAAVMCIWEGENLRKLQHKLIAHLSDDELEVVRENLDGDFSEMFRRKAAENTDREISGFAFAAKIASMIRRAYLFHQTARREGLLALEDEIDEGLLARRDLFELGIHFVLNAMDDYIIDEILSIMIAREPDEETRLFKDMQKVAVLSIQAQDTTSGIMLHEVTSLLCDGDLNIVQGLLPPEIVVFDGLPESDTAAGKEAERGELAAQVASLIRRALTFANRAKAKGLVPLDDELDPGMIRRRDVFEYGMYFAVLGVDAKIIDNILSRIIARETDEKARLLMGMKKDAVRLIQAEETSENIYQAITRSLSRDDMAASKKLLPDIAELLCPKESDDGIVVSGKFLAALRTMLEKQSDCQKAEEILNNFAALLGTEPFDILRHDDPRTLAHILAYLEPENALRLLKHLPTDVQTEVARHMAAIDPDGAETTREIERLLGKKLYAAPAGEDDYVISSILDEIKPEFKEQIVEALMGKDPELADRITSGILKHPGHEYYVELWCSHDDGYTSKPVVSKGYSKALKRLMGKYLCDKKIADAINRQMYLDDAEIMGKFIAWVFDTEQERSIIEPLEGEDAELYRAIRNSIFTFNDVVLLDDKCAQKVFREVDSFELVKAIMYATIAAQEKVFRNMPKRAGAMVREHAEQIGPIRIVDAKESQEKIISIIRHLEDTSKITIGGRGDISVPHDFFERLRETLEESFGGQGRVMFDDLVASHGAPGV